MDQESTMPSYAERNFEIHDVAGTLAAQAPAAAPKPAPVKTHLTVGDMAPDFATFEPEEADQAIGLPR